MYAIVEQARLPLPICEQPPQKGIALVNGGLKPCLLGVDAGRQPGYATAYDDDFRQCRLFFLSGAKVLFFFDICKSCPAFCKQLSRISKKNIQKASKKKDFY